MACGPPHRSSESTRPELSRSGELGHHGRVSEEKSSVEQAVELLVYAPLGFALEARELLPRLVERGRRQVTMARMIGQFAVRQGQTEAGKALGRASGQASAVLNELGRNVNAAAPAAVRPSANHTSPPPAAGAAGGRTSADAQNVPVVSQGRSPGTGPAPTESSTALAIADYDSLAASQVIPRLPGLSSGELEDVRCYEVGHRSRKTILNRIAQLQAV